MTHYPRGFCLKTWGEKGKGLFLLYICVWSIYLLPTVVHTILVIVYQKRTKNNVSEIVRESRSISILFIATQSFGFLLIRQNNNMVKEYKTKQCIVFPNQNENSTLLGLLFLFRNQSQLSPVPAGRKELPPLVEGGDPRVEHDVEFFQKAKSARFAGDVVTSKPLLK